QFSNASNLRHLKRFRSLDTINESSDVPPHFPITALGDRFNIYDNEESRTGINKMSKKVTTIKNSVDKMPVIPRFYFPVISKIQENRPESVLVIECGLPRYMSVALFCKMVELGCANERVTFEQFESLERYIRNEYYFKPIESVNDDSYFFRLEDIVMTHPGLEFLRKNLVFRERYVETVICRLFYDYNRNWSGKMTYKEFKRMDLPGMLRNLESKIDLNHICDYFSYKHFYVIYCKFWELDNDYDLRISKKDLAQYSDNALTTRMVDRVMHGYGKMTDLSPKEHDPKNPRMSYRDFIWFLLSEVDKSTNTSIEYWFRCLDCDGDGVLSVYELEWFYEEQFNHLKRCKQNAPQFFDMFFNISKFIAYEHYQQQLDEMNEIDAYVNIEYNKLLHAEQER
ncbi:28802_t:CDS:10, partial [Racocetra persica]